VGGLHGVPAHAAAHLVPHQRKVRCNPSSQVFWQNLLAFLLVFWVFLLVLFSAASRVESSSRESTPSFDARCTTPKSEEAAVLSSLASHRIATLPLIPNRGASIPHGSATAPKTQSSDNESNRPESAHPTQHNAPPSLSLSLNPRPRTAGSSPRTSATRSRTSCSPRWRARLCPWRTAARERSRRLSRRR
jgi:hypothetical protein